MGMLPRVFFTINEVAAKWGYTPADIAGWAHLGQLEIVIGIGPVDCGGEPAAGLVAISVADILPMFRRSGNGRRAMPVRRIRLTSQDNWRMITCPADGVIVSMDDLLLTAREVARFEVENEIFGRPHGGKGPDPRYDWDDFWREVAIRIHNKGVPETLKELTDALTEWFTDRSPHSDCPSDSVIRKKLSPLWNRLRNQE